MIANALKSSFRTFFPKNFLYQEVKDNFKPITDCDDFMFESLEDYLNCTLVNGILPGMDDPGSDSQVQGRGTLERTTGSSLSPQRAVEKTFNLNFQLKEGFLNWAVLFMQLHFFMDRGLVTRKEPYMGDIFGHILDERDNILLEVIFKEARISSIPSVNFEKSDTGLDTETFTVKCSYNILEINYKGLGTINTTGKQFQF